MSTSLMVVALRSSTTESWAEPDWEPAGERAAWSLIFRKGVVPLEALRTPAAAWSVKEGEPIAFGAVETSDFAYLVAMSDGNARAFALINPERASAFANGVRVLEAAAGWEAALGLDGAAMAAWAAEYGIPSDLQRIDHVLSSTWEDALDGLDALLTAVGLPSTHGAPPHHAYGEATTVNDSGGATIRGIFLRLEDQPYVMGSGEGFIGVWERADPREPRARFPSSQDGRTASEAFLVTRSLPVQSPEFGDAWRVQDSGVFPTGPGATTLLERERFLLGWGVDFLGIWDRLNPGSPVRRFPETERGRADAWNEWLRLRDQD